MIFAWMAFSVMSSDLLFSFYWLSRLLEEQAPTVPTVELPLQPYGVEIPMEIQCAMPVDCIINSTM